MEGRRLGRRVVLLGLIGRRRATSRIEREICPIVPSRDVVDAVMVESVLLRASAVVVGMPGQWRSSRVGTPSFPLMLPR